MHRLDEGIYQKNGCIDGKGDAPLFSRMKSLDGRDIRWRVSLLVFYNHGK